jgi:hypothetical protein
MSISQTRVVSLMSRVRMPLALKLALEPNGGQECGSVADPTGSPLNGKP